MQEIKSFYQRIVFITALLIVCFAVVIFRLFNVHLTKPDEAVLRRRVFRSEIPGKRGKIYDCNGVKPMADSRHTYQYFIDPAVASVRPEHRTNLIETVRHISDTLSLDFDQVWGKYLAISPQNYEHLLLNRDDPELWDKYRSRNRYNILCEKECEKIYALMKDRSLVSGVGIEDKLIRCYPNSNCMAHVVGFVNRAGVGSSGIEQRCDEFLKGSNGVVEGVADGARRRIPGREIMEVAPISGADVHLTLDRSIQCIVEKALRDAVKQSSSTGGWSIVQRVKTGEILAMASFPSFESQSYTDFSSDEWINRAVAFNYEPGSVMKPIIAAIAVNQGVAGSNHTIDVGSSNIWYYAGTPIRDHVKGVLDLQEAVSKSSNIYFGKLALAIHEKDLYDSLLAFGFGRKLDIDLPGEQSGILRSPDRWDRHMKIRIPLGSGIAVTALQLANAYSCIANGGVMMKPFVVSRIDNSEGKLLVQNKPEVIANPISKQTADAISEALIAVTMDGGTGVRAAVKGYTVAGKTGTAQKLVEGRYSQSEYYATFVGYIPARNPEVCIVVTLDAPHTRYTGGAVAAPLFSRIAADVVQYLEIPGEG